MRVFTDGACSSNGRPGAKAGYAAWFPDHPSWSEAKRIPDNQQQSNNRAELSGIQLAVQILENRGELDCDLVIYSDSDYSIKCLTIWLSGWMRRNWQTADGKEVQHQDLIKDITSRLSKFKSHRFVHVKAHTGGTDDLSVQNDVVDRMAQAVVEGKEAQLGPPPVVDEIYTGCPLRIMGPPCSQVTITNWIRANLGSLDAATIDKHLFKAFAEICKDRDVVLTKQVIQKQNVFRASRGDLQIVALDKVE